MPVTATKSLGIARNYLFIAALLFGGWGVAQLTGSLVENGLAHGEHEALLPFLEAIIILVFGFLAYETAKPTVIPSFVLVIFIGMIQRSSLVPLTENTNLLTLLTTLGAAFILFGGGLDTPFRRFKVLVWPILSIAFLGTIVTALLVSFAFQLIASGLGIVVPVGAVVLLGAAVASTDPAAIIPSLKSLVFRDPRVKDIAISESAINDVVGAVLTGVFLGIVGGNSAADSIGSLYQALLTRETGIEVLRQTAVGGFVGAIGFLILHGWSGWKRSSGEGGEADAALFMAVPLLCYFAAVFFHGSGFLAVFVAGLLFQLEEHVSHVEHYFVHTIEGFMKPLIFILLGAAVDVQTLLQAAIPGILMGLAFILIIRPLAVFLTLSPFMGGRHKISLKEMLFLSFVRETGVIPAVLLMGLLASGIPGTEMIVPVGLWVILLTLILQPPLTPLVARLLRIADNAPPFPKRKSKGPIVVLCSRGLSFTHRIGHVAAWAGDHAIGHVTILHCAEGRFAEVFIREARKEAERLFATINKTRTAAGHKELSFEFLALPGLLQDNIQNLIEADQVAIIFVGEKMLDYRLDDVKNLQVPFVFVE